ncbi:UNVERIFIED_CONTAM: hypothetical protein GTU68_025528 [Idotea baltica]|nr:hypothetical protein [Idotea baltica]
MSQQQVNQNSRYRSTTTRVESFRDGSGSTIYSARHLLQQKSLKDRIRESLPAVVIGTILMFCGASLLFWNEGEAVYTARTLDEGYNSVVKVVSSDIIDPSNENKLTHVWGALVLDNPLQDSYYGIIVRAVALKRRVQIYQWIEEESTFSSSDNPDSTDSSYSYSQLWKDKLVDSSTFYVPWGHENPK